MRRIGGCVVVLLLWAGVCQAATRVVVITDTQFGSRASLERVVQGIGAQVDQDFNLLVIPGDLTDSGSSGQYATLREVLAPLNLDYDWTSDPPQRWINASTGNHDSPSGMNAFLPVQRNRSVYPGVSGSSTGQYGTLRIGNVLVLWANRPDGASGQDAFLQATSNAARVDSAALWKFAHWHHPAASCSSGHGSDGTTAGWADNYLRPAGFQLLLQGHNHYYAVTCPLIDVRGKTCEPGQTFPTIESPEGVISITSGAAGASTRSCSGCSSWIERCVSSHGFVVIDINETTAEVRYYSVDGGRSPTNPRMDYEFWITEGPPVPHCGDGEINQPGEECDGLDDSACPGLCRSDCTCGEPGVPDLSNPGFEDAQSGWSDWESAENAGEVILSTEAHSGQRSVQMFDSGWRTRSIYQDVDTTPGVSYDVGFMVKTKNLGTRQARVRVGADVFEIGGGTTIAWSSVQAVYTADALQTRVVLELGPVTDGDPRNDAEVWYDDVYFRVAGAPTTTLTTTTTTVPITTTTGMASSTTTTTVQAPSCEETLEAIRQLVCTTSMTTTSRPIRALLCPPRQ